MAIEFGCPSCQKLVRVADGAAGKKGKCPHCSTIIQIPSAAPQPAAPALSAPKPAKPGTVSFPCPGCGKTMSAPAAMAGKKGKCPHCQTVVVIGGSAPQSGFEGLAPLGEGDLMPLDSQQAAWSDPLASPGGGLAPLGGGGDLFASLPPAPQLAAKPLPAAPNPLGYTPSTNPFGAGVNAPNPYASPNPYAASPYGGAYGGAMAGSYRPTTAPAKLMIPAILMIVVAVITIGWGSISTLNVILTPMPPPPPELDEAGQAGYKAGYYGAGVVAPLIAILVNIGVIAGAIQMIRLKSYDTAKGAAIAAIFPCSACCLNMPLGIWALIVLNQPDVRRMFQ
jgi:phage FluMu protein Com